MILCFVAYFFCGVIAYGLGNASLQSLSEAPGLYEKDDRLTSLPLIFGGIGSLVYIIFSGYHRNGIKF